MEAEKPLIVMDGAVLEEADFETALKIIKAFTAERINDAVASSEELEAEVRDVNSLLTEALDDKYKFCPDTPVYLAVEKYNAYQTKISDFSSNVRTNFRNSMKLIMPPETTLKNIIDIFFEGGVFSANPARNEYIKARIGVLNCYRQGELHIRFLSGFLRKETKKHKYFIEFLIFTGIMSEDGILIME